MRKSTFYNQTLDKKGTKRILSWFLDNYGPTRTSQFLEELKFVGFHYASIAGLSLGFDDLKIPAKKDSILSEAEIEASKTECSFKQGRITAVERYQKIIDIWTTGSENLKDEVIKNFQKTDLQNPLYMMAFSGARGNISQVRQLVGMRGLMSDSAGGIIDFPIRKNFREGLTVTEYVISCYGARKGLIDTALRTADSGYLTRRLVDVAHGIMIGQIECGTKESFSCFPLKIPEKSGSDSIILSLEKRIQGRVLAEDIFVQRFAGYQVAGIDREAATRNSIDRWVGYESTQQQRKDIVTNVTTVINTNSEKNNQNWGLQSVASQQKLARKNQEISPILASKICQKGGTLPILSVKIRSSLTCKQFQNAREDICQLCYGWSLSHARLVSLGEAVGVLAAQSIGEPGTQLTMRTFHTGGIFSTDIDAKIFAPHEGKISLSVFGLPIDKPKDSTFRKAKQMSSYPNRETKQSIRKGIDSGIIQGYKIRTFYGETAFFLFKPIQIRISQNLKPKQLVTSYPNNRDTFALGDTSIFWLPAQSLLFVYPGQKISKNTLCAEISSLLSARKSILRPEISVSSLVSSCFTSYPNRESETAKEIREKRDDRTPLDGLNRLSRKNTLENHDSVIEFAKSSIKSISQSETNKEDEEEIHLQSEYTSSETNTLLKDADDSSEEPIGNINTKKVLSEIEGQVFFHQLAERRQKTEFENISQVKGVGSLWILNGKSFLIKGPFSSGDFFVSLDMQNPTTKQTPFHTKWINRKFGYLVSLREKYFVSSSSCFTAYPNRERIPATTLQVFHRVLRNRNGQQKDIEFSCGESINQAKANLLEKKYGSLKWRKDYFLKKAVISPSKTVLNPFFHFLEKRNKFFKRMENIFTSNSVLSFRSKPSSKTRQVLQEGETGLVGKYEINKQKTNFKFGELRFFPTAQKQSKPRSEGSNESTENVNEKNVVEKLKTNEFIKSLLLQKLHLRIYTLKQSDSSCFTSYPNSEQNQRKKSKTFSTSSSHREIINKNWKIGELIRFGESLWIFPKKDQKINQKDIRLNKTTQILSKFTNGYAGCNNSRSENQSIHVVKTIPRSESINRQPINNKFTTITLRQVHPYLISNDSGLAVEHGEIVLKRQLLFELFFEKSKTGDIVQGLPKIEQLFEARRTSLHVMETVHSKLKGKFLELCKDHSIYEATLQSIRYIQRILIDEIQHVYQSQGVDISDKHIEIIVRQMTSKVVIHEKGNSPFFPDDIVDFSTIQRMYSSDEESIKAVCRILSSQSETSNYSNQLANQEERKVVAAQLVSQLQKAIFEPVVLGITKIAFLTESFVSAASFQEAKRVLMDCALQSKVDFLYGLKENVIVGRFIRAGTGFRTSVFPSLLSQ